MTTPIQTKDMVTDHKRGHYFSNNRTEMLAFLPSDCRKILEVGCGAGIFGRLIRESFPKSPKIEIDGIEIDEASALKAKAWMDRVHQGPVEKILPTLPLQQFDTIVFNDVLEHLVDPGQVLRLSIKHLAPGGCVVASVPNVRHIGNLFKLLIQKDWKYTESGILDRTHLRFFTQKSLVRMFVESGFEVDLVKGISPTKKWYLPVLSSLLLGFWRDTLYFQYALRARVLPKTT